MATFIRHNIHQRVVFALLHSPTGAVAKDMLRRGIRVQSQAKRNLGGGAGRPRRIRTGMLRNDISVRLVVVRGVPAARVGTGKNYALFVHDGTGIYGPHHRRITPKRGKVLVFSSKAYGRKRGKYAGKVVVRSVKGMVGNPFLADALIAAKY